MFDGANNVTWTAGSVEWNDVTLDKDATSDYIGVSGTANVTGDFAFTTGYINTSTINVDGDVTVGANANGGGGTICLDDASAAQDINFTGAGAICNLKVDKAAGATTVNVASNPVKIGASSLGTFTLTDVTDGFDLNRKTVTCGAFTLTAGALDIDGGIIDCSGTYTHTDGTISDTATGGKVQASGAVTGVAGSWSAGTLVFDGTSSSNWTPGTVAWYNVGINRTAAGNTITVLTSAADVTGDLTLTDGALNGQNVNVDENVTVETDFSGGTSTIVLDHASNDQTITVNGSGVFTNNLTINKAAGEAQLLSDLTIPTKLDIDDGILDVSSYDLNIATFENSDTLQIGNRDKVTDPYTSFTNDTANGGTVDYYGDGAAAAQTYTGLVGGNGYANVAFSGANDTWVLDGTLTVSATANISVATATLDAAAQNLNITTFANSGTLKIGDRALAYTSLTNDVANGGTVNYYGTNSYTGLVGGNGYANVTFSGNGGTWTLNATLTASGTANISHANATVDVNTRDLNIATFANSGTLTIGDRNAAFTSFTNDATGGTVHYNGTAVDNILAGGTDYYNLTISGGGTFNFTAGTTYTINNTTTMSGGSTTSLRSTVDGTQWKIDPVGARNIQGVDVKDSNNVRLPVIDPPSSVDSGNNINWFSGGGGGGDEPVPPDDVFRGGGDPTWLQFDSGEPRGPGYEKGKRKYIKDYDPGKYKTVIVVYEGEVAVMAYTEEGGPDYDNEVLLTAGQKLTVDGEIPGKEKTHRLEELEVGRGFDFTRVHKELDKKFSNKYLNGKYRTLVKSYEGEYDVAPYDEEGPLYKNGTTIKQGQMTDAVREVKE